MHSFWMLGTGLAFALLAACVKLLAEQGVPTSQTVFFRALIAFVILLGFMRARGLGASTKLWKTHLWRSMVGVVSLLAYFVAIRLLPLTTAVTLNYTSPIFVGLLLMMGKHLPTKPAPLAALLIGFAGVLVLLNPSFDRTSLTGYGIALASGLLGALYFMNIRHLGALGEPSMRTVLYFNLACVVTTLPWLLQGDFVQAITPTSAALLFATGALSMLGQVMLTLAYQKGKPLLSASLGYSQVVFSSLLGAWIWGDSLSIRTGLGIALIICGGILTSALTRK